VNRGHTATAEKTHERTYRDSRPREESLRCDLRNDGAVRPIEKTNESGFQVSGSTDPPELNIRWQHLVAITPSRQDLIREWKTLAGKRK